MQQAQHKQTGAGHLREWKRIIRGRTCARLVALGRLHSTARPQQLIATVALPSCHVVTCSPPCTRQGTKAPNTASRGVPTCRCSNINFLMGEAWPPLAPSRGIYNVALGVPRSARPMATAQHGINAHARKESRQASNRSCLVSPPLTSQRFRHIARRLEHGLAHSCLDT